MTENVLEMLKAHYEEARSFYFTLATENRRRFLEKLKTIMWIEIALLSAVGFLIREFGINIFLLATIFLLFINLWFLVKEFLKPAEANIPDLDKGVDWLYDLANDKERGIERFYISKIESFAKRIDQEHENVKRNGSRYKLFLFIVAIQFVFVAITILVGGG